MFVRRRDARKRAERHRKQERKSRAAWRKKEEKIKEYWDKVWEFDGFDVDVPCGPVQVFYDADDDDDDDYRYSHYRDYRDRLTFCAKIGLDWYNMRHNATLQFENIKKCIRMPFGMLSWDYYLTLVAMDQMDPATKVSFQTSFRHRQGNLLDVTWFIFRPRPPPSGVRPSVPQFTRLRHAFQWPSDFNDNNKYHVLPQSQWHQIRLYLNLAFVAANRSPYNPKLSDFKITMVAVETEESVPHRSQTVFYIMYQPCSAEGTVTTTFKAVLRRTVDLASGSFHLTGHTIPESI